MVATESLGWIWGGGVTQNRQKSSDNLRCAHEPWFPSPSRVLWLWNTLNVPVIVALDIVDVTRRSSILYNSCQHCQGALDSGKDIHFAGHFLDM